MARIMFYCMFCLGHELGNYVCCNINKVGGSYHINGMGGVIDYQVSSETGAARYFELESTKQPSYLHSDNSIVVLNGKETSDPSWIKKAKKPLSARYCCRR